ncbi:MAG TPA: sugar ABC transporter permease, partial [Candidatus Binatia bacterium]|jgi:trehalose/maltose transport system permease protein|nr:sugar ABC transporter permease [Candidatus Binatia bacterium]
MKRDRAALGFVLPSLFLVGLFSIYPIVESARLSFYRMILMLPWLGEKFVGVENYADLATDPVARGSLLITLGFVAASAALEVLVGLGMALLLNESFRARGLVRAAVLVPWAIPTVVSSQMWRYIFNDRYGLFNFLLFGGATERYLAPLAEAWSARAAIVFADVWKTSSFAALIILAGLQGIPEDLYDAAAVDGATAWQKFRRVTLPLLKPALLLALLFRTIDAFKVFDLVFVMTQGGPADATNVLQFYGYKKIFAEGMIGYGSAISVGVFCFSLLLSFFYIRLLGARVLEKGSAR